MARPMHDHLLSVDASSASSDSSLAMLESGAGLPLANESRSSCPSPGQTCSCVTMACDYGNGLPIMEGAWSVLAPDTG